MKLEEILESARAGVELALEQRGVKSRGVWDHLHYGVAECIRFAYEAGMRDGDNAIWKQGYADGKEDFGK